MSEEDVRDTKEDLSLWELQSREYRTTKRVLVRSRFLAIPQKILYVVIFVYTIIQIMWKLSFLEKDEVVAKVLTQVEQPSENFFTCSNVDTDCVDAFRPLAEFSYCDQLNLPRNYSPCRYYGVHEVQPIKYEQAFFLATSFTRTFQTRCNGSMHFSNGTQRCESLWQNQGQERHFVAGSEDFQVILQHSLSTQDQKREWSGDELRATVVDSGGSETAVPCKGSFCPATPSSIVTMSPCGSETPGPDSCFMSKRGDVLSLARILRMANISLDQKATGHVTKRMQGVAIMLDITYENERDFWTWPWGQTIKYSYRAREMDFGQQSRFRVSKWHFLTTQIDERVLDVAFGVLIVVTPQGHLGFFNFLRLVLSLSAAGTLFGLTDVFITRVLIQVYKLCKCLKLYRVYLVFQFFTQDMTASARSMSKITGSGDSSSGDVTDSAQTVLEDHSKLAKRAYWQAYNFRNKQERAEGGVFFACMLVILAFVVCSIYSNGGQM